MRRLELIRTPGVVEFPGSLSNEMLAAVLDACARLRADGHAVFVDETFETRENFELLRVFHYASCRACLKEAK